MPAAAIVLVSDLEASQSGDAQTAVDDATAVVRGYCGWHVSPVITETVVFPRWNRRLLLLPSLHVTAVSAVVEAPDILAATDYEWTTSGVLVWGSTYFPRATPRPVTVTFTHGWAEVPDLAAVIKALASRSQSAPGGGYVRQVGQVSYQNPKGDGGLLDSEKAILSTYRIPQST